MEEAPKEDNRSPGMGEAIRSVVFTLIASGAAFYLLYPEGPVKRYLGIDLAFLTVPFWGYYALRLFWEDPYPSQKGPRRRLRVQRSRLLLL